MKERPIIMNDRSVRAILDGRKTQTRRVVKPQPAKRFVVQGEAGVTIGMDPGLDGQVWYDADCANPGREIRCPHGRIGDRLWVRETWGVYGHYKVDPEYAYKATHERSNPNWRSNPTWRSPMVMLRQASRLLLEIAGVRVERLQAISRKDLIAEGIESSLRPIQNKAMCRDAMLVEFRGNWNETNAKRGHGWETNPWVWVIDFRVVEGGDA